MLATDCMMRITTSDAVNPTHGIAMWVAASDYDRLFREFVEAGYGVQEDTLWTREQLAAVTSVVTFLQALA